MGPARFWVGPGRPDLGALSHRPAGHHNDHGRRTWGLGLRKTSTSMGLAQKPRGLLPPAQGETREERERGRVKGCRESEDRDRRGGSSKHSAGDQTAFPRKSKYTPGPAHRDLVFPWQLRAGKPVLRSCLATDADDGVKGHELCPRTHVPPPRCRPQREGRWMSQHLSVPLCKMGRQGLAWSGSSGPWVL